MCENIVQLDLWSAGEDEYEGMDADQLMYEFNILLDEKCPNIPKKSEPQPIRDYFFSLVACQEYDGADIYWHVKTYEKSGEYIHCAVSKKDIEIIITHTHGIFESRADALTWIFDQYDSDEDYEDPPSDWYERFKRYDQPLERRKQDLPPHVMREIFGEDWSEEDDYDM